MTAGSGTQSSQSGVDWRPALAAVVILASGVSGGFWGGLLTNPTSGFTFPGLVAGLFLGIALACTGWIASTRPS